MKNRKYRLLSMGGFEMLDEWLSSFDDIDVEPVYYLFVQFVKQSCNLDIGLSKQRVYFYDKINGNQYYIEKKYIVELAKNEKYNYDTEYRPSLVFMESIYMDRKNNRKWINAQNLVKRY